MTTVQTTSVPKKNFTGWRLTLVRAAALIFVLALTLLLFLYREQVHELQALGYPGIFLVSLFSSATVILPLPGVLFTSVMGAVFNPFWVAVAAGTGAALGELSGYLVGFGGQGVVERTPSYEKVESWMSQYGQWAILVLAFIPSPLFDFAGMIAGGSRMPVWRFLIFCWIGKVAKMMLFAYGGVTVVKFFGG
jgi:membrane protein YqaA with SNARE-associated domain